MKYIAYKTAQNDPIIPNGFITEHFETDQESLPGYTVVSLDLFNGLFKNNITLVRTSEKTKGIVTMSPNAPISALRPSSDAEIVPADFAASVAPTDNTALFNQFLAWVAAGKPGTPSNT